MADPKVVKEWLCKADEDFNFARVNLEEGNDFYTQICFHFQQAAEKYLKAFIIAYDLDFEKTHNVIFLLKICAKKESSLLQLLERCESLNTAYIDTRYPFQWPTDYTKEKALNLQNATEVIANRIKELLENGGYV
jgi:HEPN domain-containing protein